MSTRLRTRVAALERRRVGWRIEREQFQIDDDLWERSTYVSPSGARGVLELPVELSMEAWAARWKDTPHDQINAAELVDARNTIH